MRNFGIEAWVDSFLHKNSEHPLMPHYVLDAAQFILFHVEGYYAYPDGDKREHFRLEPMVSYTDSLGPDVFGKRFKAEFTRAACCVYTKGKVPAGAHITSPAPHFSIYKSGDEFCFRVERCHLSTGFADFLHASCEAEEQRFDLMKEFKFWGSLLFHNDAHEVCRPVTVPGDVELRTFVPARWITHAFNRNQLLQPTPWEPPDSNLKRDAPAR
jgi:hypothetical protein